MAPMTAHSGGTGDKAAAGGSSSSGVPLPFAPYRDQLLHFYRIYNPSRVGDVDTLLEQYKGQEPVLFRKLYKKYCKPPEKDTAHASPLNAAASAAAAAEAADASTKQREDAGGNPRAAVRHLIAASTLERTAALDEFVRSFQGSDTELAWALRSYTRGDAGGAASPPHPEAKKNPRAALDAQITALERRVLGVRDELRNSVHATKARESDGEERKDGDLEGSAASPPLLGRPLQFDVAALAASRPGKPTERTPAPAAASPQAAARGDAPREHSMHVLLKPLGLEHLAAMFVEQDITPDLLPSLCRGDLEELGIAPDDARHILLKLRRLAL